MVKKAKKVAVVLCNGGSPLTEGAAGAAGVTGAAGATGAANGDCAAILEQCPDGARLCARGCLGGGTCATACKFGAISIGAAGVAVVDRALCRGCGLCARKCPQRIIAMRDAGLPLSVHCSNADAGAIARKACPNSCIACGICAKKCPVSAIAIQGGHAVIDDARCISCGMCAVSCPRGVIRDADGIFTRA